MTAGRPIVADPFGLGIFGRPDREWIDRIGGALADLHRAARSTAARRGVSRMSTEGARVGGGGPPGVEVIQSTLPGIEDLYRDHAAAMYRTAVTVVRDHSLAEDVVQDAIVKAWRNLDTYRHEASLRTWLLRIVHNTAVSTLRRLRDTPYDPELLPEPTVSGPEGGAIGDMFVAAFEAALFDLDETSRAAMTLRELEQLPYQEIAEILGLPLPTVKTRLFRARRRLADTLAAWKTQ